MGHYKISKLLNNSTGLIFVTKKKKKKKKRIEINYLSSGQYYVIKKYKV